MGDEELEIEVQVPRAAVKSIIGRKGATIKKVRDAGGHPAQGGDGERPGLLGAPLNGSRGLVLPPPHTTLCPQLRQETGARINVEREEEGEETALLISGSPSQVCRAKAAIHQIVTESTPVSEQLCVPQRAVGRIIGTSTPSLGEAGDSEGCHQFTRSASVVAQLLSKALTARAARVPRGTEAGSCTEPALPRFPRGSVSRRPGG